MIRAMVLAMIPCAAFAGAWDEFEHRCVDALENAFPIIVDGLAEATALPDTVRLGDAEFAFDTPDGDHLILETDPEDGFSACRVISDPARAADIAGFDRWISMQLAQNRYEPVPDELRDDGQESYLSLFWIEPVISAQIWRDDPRGLVLRIVETDLES